MSSNIAEVNLRGNGLTNRGITMIASVLLESGRIQDKLKVLDLSNNEITDEGVPSLIQVLSCL